MIFKNTKFKGAYIIEIEPKIDHRGFFARTWCEKEFLNYGINSNLVQCNISYNTKKATIRGMHYQEIPYEEAKIVRCTSGAIYDVIIDLRPGSSSYLQWDSFELTAENRKMLYIPEGFAHGFQTLENDTEVFYQMSELFHPESARGIKWNDPTFNIKWPLTSDITISDKDQSYKEFKYE